MHSVKIYNITPDERLINQLKLYCVLITFFVIRTQNIKLLISKCHYSGSIFNISCLNTASFMALHVKVEGEVRDEE